MIEPFLEKRIGKVFVEEIIKAMLPGKRKWHRYEYGGYVWFEVYFAEHSCLIQEIEGEIVLKIKVPITFPKIGLGEFTESDLLVISTKDDKNVETLWHLAKNSAGT